MADWTDVDNLLRALTLESTADTVTEIATVRDAHADEVLGLAVDSRPDRPVVYSVGGEGGIRRWSLPDLAGPVSVPTDLTDASSVAVIPRDGGTLAVVGTNSGLICPMDPADGRPTTEPWRSGLGRILDLLPLQVGDTPTVIASGSYGWAGPWDVSTGAPMPGFLRRRSAWNGGPSLVVRTAERTLLVVGLTEDGRSLIRAWDLESGQQTFEASPAGRWTPVSCLALDELDGRPVIVSSGMDATIRVWDAVDGQQLPDSWASFLILGHYALVTARRRGRPVVVSGGGDEDGRLRFTDLRRGYETDPAVAAHTDRVRTLVKAVVDGHQVVISGGRDGFLRTWRVPADLAEGRLATAADLLTQLTRALDDADAGRTPGAPGGGRLLQSLAAVRYLGPSHVAYARVLLARGSWLRGEARTAVALAQQAITTAAGAAGARGPNLDCLGLDEADLLDRITLEGLRIGVAAIPLDVAMKDRLSRADRVDANRLLSRALGEELAHRCVPREQLETLATALAGRSVPSPIVHAHHAVPDVRVNLALAWVAIGEPEIALHTLGPETGWPHDLRAQREVAEAAVRRTMDPSAPRPAPAPEPGASAATWHRWWRTARQEDVRSVSAERFLAHLDPTGTLGPWAWVTSVANLLRPAAAADDVSFALDAYEFARLTGVDSGRLRAAIGDFSARDWWWRHRREPEHAVHLALRRAALLDTEESWGDLAWFLEKGRRRRCAEIAMAEAEALRPRLPAAASDLAIWARMRFEEVDDPFGAMRAALLELEVRPPEQRRPTTRRLVRRYHLQLAAHVPSLPPLQIDETGTAPERDGVRSEDGEPWAYWLSRVAASIPAERRRHGPTRAADLVRAVVVILLVGGLSVWAVMRAGDRGFLVAGAAGLLASAGWLWRNRPVRGVELGIHRRLDYSGRDAGLLPLEAIVQVKLLRRPAWPRDTGTAYYLDALSVPPIWDRRVGRRLGRAFAPVRRRRRSVPTVVTGADLRLAALPWELSLDQVARGRLDISRHSGLTGNPPPLPDRPLRWVGDGGRPIRASGPGATPGSATGEAALDYLGLSNADVLVLAGTATDAPSPRLRSRDTGRVLDYERLQLRRRALVIVMPHRPSTLAASHPHVQWRNALLRRCAADVAAAGAHATLMLPAMPEELADEVLKRLRTSLDECRAPELAGRISRSAITDIGTELDVPPEDVRIMAGEVTLFLRQRPA